MRHLGLEAATGLPQTCNGQGHRACLRQSPNPVLRAANALSPGDARGYFWCNRKHCEKLGMRFGSLAAVLMAFEVYSCAPAQLPRGGEPIDLVVATTTDVHGRLRSWDYYAGQAEAVRGLTRAATIVDSVRAANPGRVILLDAGDLLQGNPLAYVAARVSRDRTNPVIAAMNAMQYDAAAIGNHEYNYGVPYLDSALRQAKFPFLSANTYR